ncbi:ArdC family protein, partial [Phocaeicola vulgatus]|uniref:ArdC family protein n=1 Tax=Phocaeicola vulgatus TaxID=821 RepID=UPI001C00C47B
MNGKVLERYAELMIDKIRQMSAGEWQKPWFTPRTGLPQNISGRPYNSMNRLMLYIEMDRMGYTLPVFMTFRQLKDENLMIIKGSHALPVTFYDITVKHKTTGEKISFDDYKSLPELQKQEYKVTPFMKHFYVFNIDQTDFKEKYPERYEDMRVRFSGPAVADNVKGNGNPWLDKMIKEQKWLCPIELKVQDKAYYSPSKDRIVLPAPGQFKDMESFQMTALHEMAHSTGHSSRLDRGLHHPFGTCGYAREEIIAEFTAAVTGRDLGIAVTPRKENAQYLKSWLANLKEDPGYVMSVLREAGKASAMIEESVEKQHTLADTSAREEDISPLPIKEERNNETVSSGILNMYDRSKEQYPDAMALIRRHVDLDTHLRSIIKAGSKVAINHYEKAAAPDKSMTPPLLFKGGRREIEITSGGAVIRTNGNQYDATGILKGLEKAGIDVRNISGSQWESMLRGRGTVLNPAKQKMLFSIRKQPSGYGVR